MKSAEEDAYGYTPNVSLSLALGSPCLPSSAAQYHGLLQSTSSPAISVSICGYDSTRDAGAAPTAAGAGGCYYSSPAGPRANGAPPLESPRIEITTYGQFPGDGDGNGVDEEAGEEDSPTAAKRLNSIVTLTLPNADGYRDPSCLSPASSVSSRSGHSDASSYESSFSYNCDNSPQNSPWNSPSVSPKGSTHTLALPAGGGGGGGDAGRSPPFHSHSHSSPSASPVAADPWAGAPRGSRPNSPCGAKRNLSLALGSPCLPSSAAQYHGLLQSTSSPAISVSICGYDSTRDAGAAPTAAGAGGCYYSSPAGPRANGAPPLESPRIEITTYGQFPGDGDGNGVDEEAGEEDSPTAAKRLNSIVTLTLPNADGYRDPSCLSPASSVSSRSGHSDASSYESSFSYNCDNSPQNSPWNSPSVSPKGSTHTLALPAGGGGGGGDAGRSPPFHSHSHSSPSASPVAADPWAGAPRGSRPNSPCGAKRKYSFNGGGASLARPTSSSPYSPGVSPGPSPSPGASPHRLSVTEETWLPDTNQYTNSAILAAINALTTDGVIDMGEGVPHPGPQHQPEDGAPRRGRGGSGSGPREAGDHHHHLPGRLALKKESYCGGFLDVPQHPYSWSKPKQYVSPSLPALDWHLPSSSGPYSLQMEVHRITGKTVSTPSHEVLQNNTKVLEIPLLPENNMRALIDCAGILKLRNSDIELRKGETDIGRKNTRVRMVFRVHINQPTGRTLSLQVASNPIECCEYRSAQELPLVDKQSLETCAAPGGQRMLLNGHNFQQDSKVLFVEKAQDPSPIQISSSVEPEQHMWSSGINSSVVFNLSGLGAETQRGAPSS
ncbi:hypothetical protein CRUP_019099 [Coryphaenoides rupestris]|nr:hypothetical protein CRUP_019099 [Coryphaenoides rupestris]